VSAAKFQVAEEADFVGKNAVQLHGAIGMTDELDIGRYFKRITAQRALFGTPDHHLRRYVALRAAGSVAEADEGYGFVLTDEDARFRDEIRAFFARNVTDDMRQAAANTMWAFAEFEYGRQFQKILHAHGYGAPDWPVEYGGKDWTPAQRMIWALEYLRSGAPEVMRMGRNLCAPCIMQFGTPEQKAWFLPAILAGEDWWAQGYSEPGAGSDLAALATSAARDGDDYIVNGSKIWTTYAHHANRIFCLVRTDNTARKQAGITFLLIDMDTPGIEVRPIVNIAGDHEFNQVFFTDVRVPVSRRLGDENQGWTVARHLLGLEHGAFLVQANAETSRRLHWVRDVAARETDGRGGRLLDDPDFARRLAELEIGLQALDFAASQVWGGPDAGAPTQLVSELLTIRNREIDQKLTQLAVDAVAYYALPFEPEARKVGSAIPPVGGAHTLLPTALYLSQRAATIARGTPEIHRNNLARRLLRL
jgi:acyl-CoA dehydrogenase